MSGPDAWTRAGARTSRLVGNEPIALHGATGTVRVIESGSAAVFAAEYRSGAPAGPRRLLFRIGSGQAVFAPPTSERDGLRFLLVPIKEAVVREGAIDAAWADPALRPEVAHLFDEWVDELASVLVGGAEPKLVMRAEPGRDVLLDEGDVLAPERHTVIWPRIDDGEALFMSRPDHVLDPASGPMPLVAGMWIEADTPAKVRTLGTVDVAEPGALERGLGRLHTLVLTRIRTEEEAEEQDELVRLLQRDLVAAESDEAALDELASVLDPREPKVVGDTPLLRVMSVIGRRLGVRIRPPGRSEGGERSDPIEGIARASRIRMRRVTLSGKWWKRDSGPLLAFTTEEEPSPVALLPRRPRGYDLFDPSEPTRRVVDAKTLRELAPEAVVFYRPLPDGRLGLRDLFRFALHGRGRDLALVAFAGIVITLLGMVTPQATAVLMDQALPDANRRLLFEIGAGLLAAAVGRLVFEFAEGIVQLRIGLGSEAESQAAVWDRLLRLRPSFFRQFSSGDLQSRVTAVNEVGRELSDSALTLLFSGLVALLNLALLHYYSASLALLAVTVGLLVAGITSATNLLVRRNLRLLLERDGSFFGFVVQLVGGVGKLRVAGATGRAYTQWVRRYGEILALVADILRLRQVLQVFNHALPMLSSALLFLFAFRMLEESRSQGLADGLTLGSFLAFNVAFATFLGGLTSLGDTLVGFVDIFAKARRIQPILEAEPETDEHKADPGRLSGRVALRSVDFRYRADGALTLDGISLEAEPGEFVALVGPSGSGKSTTMRLLLGFDRASAGSVQYDGQDLAGLDVLAVRRQLGVILQGGRLDAGSIFENIASGNVITLDEAWAAAEDAGFADEVREMPMGLHTIVSVGGGNLSGGQRQRLLIARALAHRPRILLFDEATSALDNRTQAIVAESLERLHVTRIVIAHRLSTVRNADRIYVIDAGRVVQSGSFDELMRASDGLFARMMARQLA
jgi:NHLM bacteriocin system ABC transporter ATP-binding protein